VLYEESLTLFRALGDKRGIAYGLEGMARVSTAPGAALEVRERAAAALRQTIGALLSLNERADHDRKVAAVRTALGDAAFGAAWAEGQTLTLDQAIAYALEAVPLANATK
jgi:hypothetical protein